MKKIFKKTKIEYLIIAVIFLITGVVIGGVVGVTATTNKLEAKYVMYTKDGETMTVQDAIKGLYTNLNKVATNIETLPTGVKAIVYLDPTDLTKECNQFNSTIGGTGTKSGCMKWYAFKEDDTSYTMILDHNTTARVAWNSDNVNTSKKEVQIELDKLYPPDEEIPSNWKVKPRLITGQEIADITGNTSWTAGGSSIDFNSDETSTRASKYYWLFDYTSRCTSWGCKVADSSNSGYWTDTPDVSSDSWVWLVHKYGRLVTSTPANTDGYGLRPVITVQKSNL